MPRLLYGLSDDPSYPSPTVPLPLHCSHAVSCTDVVLWPINHKHHQFIIVMHVQLSYHIVLEDFVLLFGRAHLIASIPKCITIRMDGCFGCICIYFNPYILEWIRMKLSLISLKSNSTHVYGLIWIHVHVWMYPVWYQSTSVHPNPPPNMWTNVKSNSSKQAKP